MFCRQCGSEISNDAKFCTFCGTKTVAPAAQQNSDATETTVAEIEKPSATCDFKAEEGGAKATGSEVAEESPNNNASGKPNNDFGSIDMAAKPSNDKISGSASAGTSSTENADAGAQTSADAPMQTSETDNKAAEPSNLKAAVVQNKKRSRRRLPMILLVALALALATSVAYAAYRVYTDVWLPYQAEQEQLAKHPLKDADGDTVTSEISGDAKNALQIANLMMMDPTAIPDFLDEQGLTYSGTNSYGTSLNYNGNWSISQFAYLENACPGTFDKDRFLGQNSVNLYIGDHTNIVSPHELGSTASKKMLESGTKPTGIMIGGLPLKQGLSDEEISSFCNACNLGSPLEKFSTTALAYGNEKEDRLTVSTVFTGIAAPADNSGKIVWYLTISDNECLFGCISIDNAYNALISPYDLYSQDEWNKADNREKALMIAQSVSQEWWGAFDYRLNVLTGKIEAQSATSNSWAEATTSASGYTYISPFDGSTFSEHDISYEYVASTFQSETADL